MQAVRSFIQAGLMGLVLCASSIAMAQLKLGQSVDISGVTAAFAKDYIRGVKAGLDAANKSGGI